MLSLPPSVRLFVATQAVDGRKGADSLMVIVRDVFGHDPLLCVVVRYVAAVVRWRQASGFRRGRRETTRHIIFKRSRGSGGHHRAADSGRLHHRSHSRP